MNSARHVRMKSDDVRYPFIKRQATHLMSGVSTATDFWPSSTPSSHSRSRTEKSAERIASYLTAYGSESLTERSRLPSKASLPTLRPTTERPGDRDAETAEKARVESNLRSLGRQIATLADEVTAAKSDKLELLRDLACFECSFAKSAALRSILTDVHTTAASLPLLTASLTSVSSDTAGILQTLHTSFTALSTLRPRSPHRPGRLRKPKVGLRNINSRHHIRPQYHGTAVVSGVKCLVCVAADESLRHFRVTVAPLRGGRFECSFTHDLAANLSSKAERIKARLLPHLHFVSLRHMLSLHFDEHCGAVFCTLLSRVKGTKEELCLMLTQDDDCLNIRTDGYDSLISVPLSHFTAKRSIFDLPLTEVRDALEPKLGLRGSPGQLIWLEDVHLLFSYKEKISKLMDAEFLSEALGDFVLVLMAKEEVIVDGQTFTVEFYAHKTVERMRICSETFFLELDPESKPLKLLSSLQFTLLQRAPKTVTKSLELMQCIRSLFLSNHKHDYS